MQYFHLAIFGFTSTSTPHHGALTFCFSSVSYVMHSVYQTFPYVQFRAQPFQIKLSTFILRLIYYEMIRTDLILKSLLKENTFILDRGGCQIQIRSCIQSTKFNCIMMLRKMNLNTILRNYLQLFEY